MPYVLLDTLGTALAAPTMGGTGLPALSFNGTTHLLTLTPDRDYNGTAAEIQAIGNAYNAYAASVTPDALVQALGQAIGAIVYQGNGLPALAYAPTQLTYTSGRAFYALPAQLPTLRDAFNAMAASVLPPPPIYPDPPECAADEGLRWFGQWEKVKLQSIVIAASKIVRFVDYISGSDTTGDGSRAKPWRTGLHAYRHFLLGWHAGGQTIELRFLSNHADSIQLGGGISDNMGGLIGPQCFRFMSYDPANPVTFSAPAGLPVFSSGAGARIYISDMVLAPGVDGIGMLAAGGEIFAGAIFHAPNNARACVYSIGGSSSITQFGGPWTFVHGTSAQSAIISEDNGQLNAGGNIIVSGSPSFVAFAQAGIASGVGGNTGGMLDFTGASFSSGPLSCLKGSVYQGGRIWMGGGSPNSLPGTGFANDGTGTIV